MKNKKAFTLIELLVVVLIIGILAAVAVPQYEKAVEKSRVTQALTFLDAIYKGYQLCVLQNGKDWKKCGKDDQENLATNNLFVNMDIELPGELLTGDDCEDGTVCVKTKDWDFGTSEIDIWHANRIKNGEYEYSLALYLNEENNGKIQCNGGSVCSSLCGSNPCWLK